MKISVGGVWTFLAGLITIVAWFGGTVCSDESTSGTESETVMHSPLPNRLDMAMKDSPPSGPYFDSSTPLNVTAQHGKTAYLHCQVRQLGNKTVSWVRHRDLHILTVGRYTYITDQRFQAYHLADTDDWTLQIRYTQARDAGTYECQVSTEPKMSLLINLNVVVPKSIIHGGPDMYVKTGSTITLKCFITQSPEKPVFIFWYHEDKVLNYETSRRSIVFDPVNEDTTISKLLITKAQSSDSGNYTCTPSNTEPTSITVHVLNGDGAPTSAPKDLDNTMLSDTLTRGEKPKALQHGKQSSGSHRCVTHETIVALIVTVVVFVVSIPEL